MQSCHSTKYSYNLGDRRGFCVFRKKYVMISSPMVFRPLEMGLIGHRGGITRLGPPLVGILLPSAGHNLPQRGDLDPSGPEGRKMSENESPWPLGPGAQKVQNGVDINYFFNHFGSFPTPFWSWTPGTERFGTLSRLSDREGANDPCSKPKGFQASGKNYDFIWLI